MGTPRTAGAQDGLLRAHAEICWHPRITHARALLVAHRGELVFERYYGGTSPDDLCDMHSVTKSWVSTVVGTLLDDGVLDLDMSVASVLDSPAFDADPGKRAITIRHLLTMTSGLECRGMWDIDDIGLRGATIVAGVLGAPLRTPPGTSYAYNNGAVHLLSAIVETITGTTLADVAAARLLAPLGIERWDWPKDPQGLDWACGGLRLAPRDLLKLGTLYLGGGAWDGRPVVSTGYVRMASSAQNAGGLPERCAYGLLWWVADQATPPHYFAAGYGGQYVFVVPDLDLVVVAMSDADAVVRPFGIPFRNVITGIVVPSFLTGGQPMASNKRDS